MRDFKEFPKCLYKDNELYGEFVIVNSPEEEAAEKENGFGVEAKKPVKKAEK